MIFFKHVILTSQRSAAGFSLSVFAVLTPPDILALLRQRDAADLTRALQNDKSIALVHVVIDHYEMEKEQNRSETDEQDRY